MPTKMILLSGLIILAAMPKSTRARETMLLHVGATGIHCAREPCPARGIYPADAQPRDRRAALLYAGLSGNALLPRLEASTKERALLERSWYEYGCLLIEGGFQPADGGPILRVQRILGEC